MTVLLDTVGWSPGEALDADGTVSLLNWRADNASLEADELGVSLTIASPHDGRIDVRGPLRVSGPLGDGMLEQLEARLDLAGWSDHDIFSHESA